MRIAVTGAMGFIGHELIEKLADAGHEVVAVDFYTELIGRYERNRLPIMQDLYRSLPKCHSVVDPWEFVYNIERFAPQVVVHAGAVVDTKDLGSAELFDKNIRYTELLTDGCYMPGSHLIFISSAAVYGANGSPNNPYGLSKALGEKIVGRARTRTTSLRLFNVFGKNEHHKGPMSSVAFQLAEAYRLNREFKLHSWDAKRDFVPSSSVVNAIANVVDEMAMPGEIWHRTFDVGTGKPISFRELRHVLGCLFPNDGENPVKLAEIPSELVGRYQSYTCAGTNGIVNIGGMIDTVTGLKDAYGQS